MPHLDRGRRNFVFETRNYSSRHSFLADVLPTIDNDFVRQFCAPGGVSMRVKRTTKLIASGTASAVLSLLAFGADLDCLDRRGQRLRAQERVTPKHAAAKPQRGVLVRDSRACEGYTLIAPLHSQDTFLIDLEGLAVKRWRSDWKPALSAYLLDDGSLLRSGALLPSEQPYGGPGCGGHIQRFTWEGELLWDFKFVTNRLVPHHDIAPLPNGNVLVVAWDRKTEEEAIAAGRDAGTIQDGHLLPDCVLEVEPRGKTGGAIVWSWHVWDHLIQDHDATKGNFGRVAEHPELIDVNFSERVFESAAAQHAQSSTAANKPATAPAPRKTAYNIRGGTRDWTHINAVAYNVELDQIVLSAHAFSEIWIIDHSTTTAEAASHRGGRHGKGGDLLYRWGNPRAHRAGSLDDQRLFSQHSAHWIDAGLSGAGHILLFNNGNRRPGGPYSTADEIALPVAREGHYDLRPGKPAEPASAVWSYAAPKPIDLYSMIISGAQRLPNGNTLICSGASGTLLEVTPDKNVVWKFVNPVKGPVPRPRHGHAEPAYWPVGGSLGFATTENKNGSQSIPPVAAGGAASGMPPLDWAVFRAYRYAPEYPGLRGRMLDAGPPLETFSYE